MFWYFEVRTYSESPLHAQVQWRESQLQEEQRQHLNHLGETPYSLHVRPKTGSRNAGGRGFDRTQLRDLVHLAEIRSVDTGHANEGKLGQGISQIGPGDFAGDLIDS